VGRPVGKKSISDLREKEEGKVSTGPCQKFIEHSLGRGGSKGNSMCNTNQKKGEASSVERLSCHDQAADGSVLVGRENYKKTPGLIDIWGGKDKKSEQGTTDRSENLLPECCKGKGGRGKNKGFRKRGNSKSAETRKPVTVRAKMEAPA